MKASGAVIEEVRDEIHRRRDAGEVWYYEYDRPIEADTDAQGNVTLRLTDETSGTLYLSHHARDAYRQHPGTTSGHFILEPVDPVAIERDDASGTTVAEVWAALNGLRP